MNRILLLLILLGILCGCAMLKAWKSIPPPGGCDQCHHVPISANWQVTYKAPTLNDERDRLSFQTEQYNMPQGAKPASSLEIRKEQDQLCFDCHKSPDTKHMERKGRYHHQ
jgi:hypothetical protein